MIPFKKALSSPVGRKLMMSISGIALVLFVIVHLLGNLTLFLPEGAPADHAFNQYARGFEAMGPVLYVIELGLLAVIVVHIGWGITTWWKNRKARSDDYAAGQESKGGPSNLSLASKNMIVTGGVLLVFLVVHIWNFRIGKVLHGDKYTHEDGEQYYDLYGLVLDLFEDPLWVAFYVITIAFLAFHVRHGFWSALQSLGAMKPEWSKPIYALGLLVAVVLTLGFIGIPLYMYLNIHLGTQLFLPVMGLLAGGGLLIYAIFRR